MNTAKYLDILKNFVETTDEDKVMQICRKEGIFAGFWLECMFVTHYQTSYANLSFDCLCLVDDKKKSKKITITFRNIQTVY